MKKLLWLAAAISLILCLTPLAALQIHQYEKARHLRFEEGTFPGSPVQNPTLWADDYIFNGVGWSEPDPRKGFALISPRHFVGANHFRPPIGSQIAFHARDGQRRSYTYERFYNIVNENGENTDIFIGELSENIPASHGIPLYPVLDATEAALVGREIIVYGRGESGPRIGRNTIASFGDSFGSASLNDTRNYNFEYLQPVANQDDAYGETGDSGSPSFIVVDGMLTVSGIHSAVGGTVTIRTYDSFLLHYRDQFDTHLGKTGHQLTVAPIPNAGLEITAIARLGSEVVLSVANPSGLPYDVHRTTDLTGAAWEIVATSQTGPTWTGEIPIEADRVFWKLVRYPLPIATTVE